MKLFTAQYSKNVGIVYEYVITSDEIDVKVMMITILYHGTALKNGVRIQRVFICF